MLGFKDGPITIWNIHWMIFNPLSERRAYAYINSNKDITGMGYNISLVLKCIYFGSNGSKCKQIISRRMLRANGKSLIGIAKMRVRNDDYTVSRMMTLPTLSVGSMSPLTEQSRSSSCSHPQPRSTWLFSISQSMAFFTETDGSSQMPKYRWERFEMGDKVRGETEGWSARFINTDWDTLIFFKQQWNDGWRFLTGPVLSEPDRISHSQEVNLLI